MTQYATIAELQNFIVLDSYTKAAMLNETPAGYQTEAQLESELITDLRNQGYEYLPNLNSPEALLNNARIQLQALNNIVFTDAEWKRFNDEFLNKENDGIVERTRKIQGCCVYDFTFDDGHLQNITLIDKQNHARNKLQVINQFEQTGTQANRYDVTILVNGLPMVQVELKKRGVNIREAFNQVHRYSKESFNSDCSLYKYLQIFVISNGTDTRYFANTVKRNKNSFDFTMNWATFDNKRINDLKDFTATFLQKNTVSIQYSPSFSDMFCFLSLCKKNMFALNETNVYRVCCTPVDMRQGILHLCQFVRGNDFNPSDGCVYVFYNRPRNRIKLLHWERCGFVVYHKQMAQGCLSGKIMQQAAGFYELRWDELVLYMEGINPRCYRRKRYNKP